MRSRSAISMRQTTACHTSSSTIAGADDGAERHAGNDRAAFRVAHTTGDCASTAVAVVSPPATPRASRPRGRIIFWLVGLCRRNHGPLSRRLSSATLLGLLIFLRLEGGRVGQ